MGLSPAEVGLELHHGIAPSTPQPLHRSCEKVFQALGEKSPPEKFNRLTILIRAFTQMHLPEISGKLRLLISPTGYILVRGDYFAPGFEARANLTLYRSASGTSLLGAHLLVEAHP